MSVTIRTVGGPTTVVDIGGRRLLVDPTFDQPRDYDMGGGRRLTKTQGPAVTAADIGPLDAVLLSHDQHADNLDESGRALLADVPVDVHDAARRRAARGHGDRPGAVGRGVAGLAHDHRRAGAPRTRGHRAPRRPGHRLRAHRRRRADGLHQRRQRVARRRARDRRALRSDRRRGALRRRRPHPADRRRPHARRGRGRRGGADPRRARGGRRALRQLGPLQRPVPERGAGVRGGRPQRPSSTGPPTASRSRFRSSAEDGCPPLEEGGDGLLVLG